MARAWTKQHLNEWLRKLPFVAFLFFLAKGLLWLIVPLVLIAFQAADG